MKQPIHEIVKDMFLQFIIDHQEALEDMEEDAIKSVPSFSIAVGSDIGSLGVVYVAKVRVGQYPKLVLHYFFLSSTFDKLYTHRASLTQTREVSPSLVIP